MELSQIVTHLKQQLGSKLVIKKRDKSYLNEGEDNFVILLRDFDNNTVERIVEVEGDSHSFELIIAKDLDSVLRKKIFGWYIGLHATSNTEVYLTISDSDTHRSYLNKKGDSMAEISLDDSKYYSLFLQQPVVSTQTAREVIRQINIELRDDFNV